MNDDLLPSWRDTPTRRAIIDFVESIGDVSVEERVAVFDNDGTLWCEKPMPIELGFILERLAEMAEQDASLHGRQPWKAAHEKDDSWLGDVITYQEDEHGGSIVYEAEPDVFGDGPIRPVRIWSRVGRRPLVAGGNSNGDIPMLQFAGGATRPALRLLVLHDDAEREFDYTAGAERAVERARSEGWTLISVKDDWESVFADA
jgi:hypothetical protein